MTGFAASSISNCIASPNVSHSTNATVSAKMSVSFGSCELQPADPMLAHLMSTTQLGLFLAAALILAFTPGPGIMYVMARTLSGGTPDGIASTLGTAVGGMVHVAVAAVGLSALLAASAQGFLIVKYVGALYLAFLGLRSILSARRAPAIPAI